MDAEGGGATTGAGVVTCAWVAALHVLHSSLGPLGAKSKSETQALIPFFEKNEQSSAASAVKERAIEKIRVKIFTPDLSQLLGEN